MNTIELDATHWKDVEDFYDAFLHAVGAPNGHGRNPNAVIDSVIWGGMNSLNPPLRIQIKGMKHAPEDVVEEIETIRRALAKASGDFRVRRGRDIDVRLETTL